VIRQSDYIISAFLLFLLLFAGGILIEHLSSAKPVTVSYSSQVIDTDHQEEFVLSANAVKGEILFQNNCAVCHQLFKNSTGPGLISAIRSDRWSDKQRFFEWIRNPALFMEKDEYTRDLKGKYGSMMRAFPEITREQTDCIHEYLMELGDKANYIPEQLLSFIYSVFI